MKTPAPGRSPAKADRRHGVDRRKVDSGPPAGIRERRKSVEPRQPDVQELDITPSEWDRLGIPPPPADPQR